jgi:hypothetical protein
MKRKQKLLSLFVVPFIVVIILAIILLCINIYRHPTYTGPKWIIIQYDDREIKEIYKPLIERNKKYCKMHGYQHIFVKSGYTDLPPYWRKVQLTIDTLKNNPSCKGVMWLDTDAAFADYNKKIEDYVKSEKSMYIAKQSNGPINSGVWFVKNDAKGLEIMNNWMESYKKTKWTKNGNTWETTGSFGGPNYEQGAFIDLVYPNYIAETEYYEWYILQSQVPSKEVFTVHFFGGQDSACKTFTSTYPV